MIFSLYFAVVQRAFFNQQKLLNIIQFMQSTFKQQANNVSGDQQVPDPSIPTSSIPVILKQQQLSSSEKSPSQMNVQKMSSPNCNVSKPLNQANLGVSTSDKPQISSKPTNDRQEENLGHTNAGTSSYPAKKNDKVIEIIDDDGREEHKAVTLQRDVSLANKQKFKNKQISNQLRPPPSNIKADNYSIKANEFQRNEPPHQKNHPQISKPQPRPQKYSQAQSKSFFEKNNQIPLPKHLEYANKLPFSSSLHANQFYPNQFMNFRPDSYHDSLYRSSIGMGYPHSMMNYPNHAMSDPFRWPVNPSAFDRFGIPPTNHNLPFNYLFGQNQHTMMGKNMLPMNHAPIPGMKGYGQMGGMSGSKPFGPPEPLLKDDKLHPAIQKQLYSHINANERREEQKRKQNPTNLTQLPKEQIHKSITSHINQIQAQVANAKEVQKKDSIGSIAQKKIQPEVIELLDSDDQVKDTKKPMNFTPEKPMQMSNPAIDQRMHSYGHMSTGYSHKPQNGYNQFKMNPSYDPFEKLPIYQFSKNIPMRQYPNQTGKSYKEQQDELSHLQKTKQIHKQTRPDHGKIKPFNDNKNQLIIESLESIEGLKKIQQHRQNQQNDLKMLLSESEAFLQNTFGPRASESFNFQSHFALPKPSISQHPQQTMKPETYVHEKLIDLQNYFTVMKKDSNLLDVEQMKQLEEYYNRAGVEISKYKDQQALHDPKSGKMQADYNVAVRQQKTINANLQHENVQPGNIQQQNPAGQASKQIPGNDHVRREAQKAFQKTRSRMNNQQNKQSAQYNEHGKKILTYERMRQIKQDGRRGQEPIQKKVKTPTMLKKETSEKQTRDKDRIQCENQDKDNTGGWVFEWTPKLKRIRDLSKKRQYDSVILTGPQFQAQIPKFITDPRELRILKAIKRANLLKRLYKYCAEI